MKKNIDSIHYDVRTIAMEIFIKWKVIFALVYTECVIELTFRTDWNDEERKNMYREIFD